jgi:hypothetical protein
MVSIPLRICPNPHPVCPSLLSSTPTPLLYAAARARTHSSSLRSCTCAHPLLFSTQLPLSLLCSTQLHVRAPTPLLYAAARARTHSSSLRSFPAQHVPDPPSTSPCSVRSLSARAADRSQLASRFTAWWGASARAWGCVRVRGTCMQCSRALITVQLTHSRAAVMSPPLSTVGCAVTRGPWGCAVTRGPWGCTVTHLRAP